MAPKCMATVSFELSMFVSFDIARLSNFVLHVTRLFMLDCQTLLHRSSSLVFFIIIVLPLITSVMLSQLIETLVQRPSGGSTNAN